MRAPALVLSATPTHFTINSLRVFLSLHFEENWRKIEATFQFSFKYNFLNRKQPKGKSDLIITYNFPNVPDPVTS